MQKCVLIVLKTGKRVEDEGIPLVDDKVLANLLGGELQVPRSA